MNWFGLSWIIFAYCANPSVAFPENYSGNPAIVSYKVHVNTEKYIYQTEEKFLSIALDSGLIKWRWENFNFSSVKLHNLAKGLAPAYLRIGGTEEDFLVFDRNETYRKTRAHDPPQTNFTMTAEDVDKIFTFAKENGLSLIFGLNVLLRDSNMNWDTTNALKLMEYIGGRGFACGWELGNEPCDIPRLVNRTITGKELALDFKILRKLLNEHPEYGNFVVGPDISSPWRQPSRPVFLNEFLTNEDGSINGLTYHQYYTSMKATVADFYDPELLDSLITEIEQLQRVMKDSGAGSMDLWLGETSSAYDGGKPGVSDSYIAGFMWLDKLGVTARLAHKVVIRQTLYGGSYALIDQNTLDPYPDYWSSLLYKRLIGSRVLEVHDGITLGRKIRVYAHCTSKRSNYKRGSLVLLALNTQHYEVQLQLTNELEKLSVDQYLLTPGDNNNLTSQTVRLNGEVLQLVNDTLLPSIEPKPIIPPDIILPPVSYGFFVIPEARIEACLQSSSPQNLLNGPLKV